MTPIPLRSLRLAAALALGALAAPPSAVAAQEAPPATGPFAFEAGLEGVREEMD